MLVTLVNSNQSNPPQSCHQNNLSVLKNGNVDISQHPVNSVSLGSLKKGIGVGASANGIGDPGYDLDLSLSEESSSDEEGDEKKEERGSTHASSGPITSTQVRAQQEKDKGVVPEFDPELLARIASFLH